MYIGSGAGHGGNDPGAVAYGYNERDIARQLTAAFNSYLPNVINCTVDSGYPDNVNVPVSICNNAGVELAIQHHLNAGGGTGCEVLYWAGDAKGQQYAEQLSAAIANHYGFYNRGAKARGAELGFLKSTNMTAVMIEWGFMDSPNNQDLTKILADINGGAYAAAQVLGASAPPAPSRPEGWTQDGEAWAYVRNGLFATGWQYLTWSGGENWFYFDETHATMKTGWQFLKWSGGEHWFYFDDVHGNMLTGWHKLADSTGEHWFFLDEEHGYMHTGWLNWDNSWWHIDNNGRTLFGWHWLSFNGEEGWFYFEPEGESGRGYDGIKDIGDTKYLFHLNHTGGVTVGRAMGTVDLFPSDWTPPQ